MTISRFTLVALASLGFSLSVAAQQARRDPQALVILAEALAVMALA